MTKKEDLIALYDGCEKHFDAKVIFMLIGDHFIVKKIPFLYVVSMIWMMIITCICHHHNIRILDVMPTRMFNKGGDLLQ